MTKDGRKTDTANTFTLKDEECKNWKLGKCRFGKKCWRKHVGPGGCLPDAGKQPRGNRMRPQPETPPTAPAPEAFVVGDRAPSTPVCQNCKGLHLMKDCPIANVLTFDSEKRVDYVFMAQTTPDSYTDDNQKGVYATLKRGLPADPPGALRGPSGGPPGDLRGTSGCPPGALRGQSPLA